ncbi:MAG: methyltransferase domain-containing protein [Desulfobacteraceae bacterium]|nr:methyltransferase domain-containing protein [Desulfobacteraceae bacterium]
MDEINNSIENMTSLDSLFNGSLSCRQNVHGYRFSLDSVIVAHFPDFLKGDTILDLGCGCGVIGLIVLYRWRHLVSHLTGVEIQPALLNLAKENMTMNGYEKYSNFIEGDIRAIRKCVDAESFSKVICNPPFYTTTEGRGSHNEEAFIARHQLLADLNQILQAAKFSVKNKGHVVIIYPAEKVAALLHMMIQNSLEPKRMQMIYSYKNQSEAKLVVVDAVKNGGKGVRNLPPFYIYEEKGRYSEAMEMLYTV